MEPDEDLFVEDFLIDYKVLDAALRRCNEALDRNDRPNTSDQRTVLEAASKYLNLMM